MQLVHLVLDNGFPFDGSSIDAWQPIQQIRYAFKARRWNRILDPFTADPTIIIFVMFMISIKVKCMKNVQDLSLKSITVH